MTEKEFDPEKTVPLDDTSTIALDGERTIPLEPLSRAASAAENVGKRKKRLFGFRIFSFRKRRDVGSVIELLRDKRPPQEVAFPGNEERLDLIEDNYELGREFAEGGQGKLYSGFDRRLRRLVAIKSLRRELSGRERQRRLFLTEARVTAQLDHPAIVPIYALNSDRENGLHLAMKLVNGENFKSYLEQVVTHYRLDGINAYDEEKSLHFRLDVLLKVCDALEYAHSRNVMHGDLKPANIMIGEYHETYIMDWGIARRIGEKPEETETPDGKKGICGTPHYLAPEMVVGEVCDQRADIFAMGVILFEAVTLKSAFTGSSVQELMENIRDGRMEPLEHRFHVRIDRDLKAVIRKATATSRDERYQTIGELSEDLRRCLMGLEVRANPDNPAMKAVRWCYIHRRMTLILMLTALLIGAGALAFSLYREFRVSEEMRKRDYALGMAYSVSTHAGYRLDEQFSKLEQMTDALAADVQFLLDYDVHKESGHGNSSAAFYPVAEIREKGCPGLVDSVFHHGRISPDAVAYHTTPDTDLARLRERLDPISRFIPRLLQTILESPVNAKVTLGNLERLKRSAFLDGTPIIRVLFGFADGLYVAYPASGAFPAGYDPRRRVWYGFPENPEAERAVWSKPYIDGIPEIGLVISCSVPLYSAKGRADGVCAVDISLSELIEELHSSGNSGDYVLEKAIVDDSGQIIVSTTRDFANAKLHSYSSSDEEPTFAKLDNEELWNDLKERKFGLRVTRDSKGEMVVYTFCHIRSVNWFYLEKLSLEGVMKFFQDFRPLPGDAADDEKSPAKSAGR